MNRPLPVATTGDETRHVAPRNWDLAQIHRVHPIESTGYSRVTCFEGPKTLIELVQPVGRFIIRLAVDLDDIFFFRIDPLRPGARCPFRGTPALLRI